MTDTQFLNIVLKKLEFSLQEYNENKLIKNNYKYIDNVLEIYINKNYDIRKDEIQCLAKSIIKNENMQVNEIKEEEVYGELLEIRNEFIKIKQSIEVLKEFLDEVDYKKLNKQILNKSYVNNIIIDIIDKLNEVQIRLVS